MPETFLHDCVIVEVGDRLAVGACGSLLAQLGATVVLIEDPDRLAVSGTKWAFRPLIAAGKRSVRIANGLKADRDLLAQLMARADVLLVSSDMDARQYVSPAADTGSLVVCDLSAFGTSGPLAYQPYSDALVQAIAGALDSTGSPDGGPTISKFPLMEFTAALYGASAVLSGLRARTQQGVSQRIEVALYDVAITMLASFLPKHFVGGEPGRIGNHHPSMSPWNLYRTRDGWVLICAGSDEQWSRMCDMFGHAELADDERFASPTMRVRNHVAIDEIVEQWTKELTVAECVARFNAAAIACGPVYSIAELFKDPSLEKRAMFCDISDPTARSRVRVPGALFHGSLCTGEPPLSIPRPDQDRAFVTNLLRQARSVPTMSSAGSLQPPLAGVRVLELGNYTTAPLVGRQFGALGAYVVKVEAPGGDLGRPLPPVRNGQGYFFTLGNSDKRTLVVDLRTPAGKTLFAKLLRKADILVENLKIGSLARLGFDEADVAQINPRLVHCSITGFGSNSPYSDRPAMDTTVQGMSGIMDLTRSTDGVPYKTGISIADLAGGQLGLVAALAALDYRDRTGRGQHIDLSMQSASAWLTQTAWNLALPDSRRVRLMRCFDGYVAIDVDDSSKDEDHIELALPDARNKTRVEAVEQLSQHGIACASVLSVSEAARHPQTQSRHLIVSAFSKANVEWPLLACPIRFSKTPATVRRAIAPAGADDSEVMGDWGLVDDQMVLQEERRKCENFY